MLKNEKIEDKMAQSLTIPAQVSIQFIMDSDIESMDLFFLLGMLPGGISPKDLDELWLKVESVSKFAIKADKDSFIGSQVSPKSTLIHEVESADSPWRRAFNKLLKGKLVEEV